jgi:hypothetical protein
MSGCGKSVFQNAETIPDRPRITCMNTFNHAGPAMTTTAAHNSSPSSPRPVSQRVVAMKWLVVLAALSIATVLDGLSVQAQKPDGRAFTEQATITLPAERCGPGCAIMVASNQTGDAFTTQAR